MKKLFALLLALFAIAAYAATVTWTPPTQNTDGSTIPATGPGSIASYRIEWGTCNGAVFGTVIGQVTVTSQPSQVPDPPAGSEWCYRVFAINTFGMESDPSNVARKVVAPPKPNPPTNFSIG